MNYYSAFVLILCVTVSDGKDKAESIKIFYGQDNTKDFQLAIVQQPSHFLYDYIIRDTGNAQPIDMFYKQDNTISFYLEMAEIPTDAIYYYTIYNTERVFQEGIVKKDIQVYVKDEVKVPNNYSYYISMKKKDLTWNCEPTEILRIQYSKSEMDKMYPIPNDAVVTIKTHSEGHCYKEIFDLRNEVISPKHNSIDDGILRYNVGDKIKLLCSEKTKNKRIYMQWNILSNLYKESITRMKTTHIPYDLYLEMDLKSCDNGTLVYCSVVTGSGQTLQTSNNIRLELIGQTDATEVITAIYLKSAEELNTHFCGQGEKAVICITNDMSIYCQNYLEDYYNGTAKLVRYISNEIAHYVNENGVPSANLDIILGVSVTITTAIVAIIAMLLYRRGQRLDIEASVPNSSPEPVYEEIPEDVPPSTRLDSRRGLHHIRGIRLNHETGVLTVHENCFRRVSIKRENEL